MKSELMPVRFYECEQIDAVPWPDTAYGRYAKAYLEPLIRSGTETFIVNVRTRLLLAEVGGTILPITVNEAEYDNSYVCSPYTHYITYAIQELSMLKQPLLERSLAVMLHILGAGFRRSDMNRVVHVNNWLLSTNLYPSLQPEHITALCLAVKDAFPDYAIIFRSLNRTTTPAALEALNKLNITLVPSRQIYIYPSHEPKTGNAKSRWLLKRDLSLLEQQGYKVVSGHELSDAQIPRMIELYNQLYLEKYSYCNPQFRPEFLSLALHSRTLEVYGLMREGRLDAVLGFYERDGIMTTPLFGYDTAIPQEVGLYRMLSAVLLRMAEERGVLLHESSGAAQFKRNRGAAADIEYSAVYMQHLPWSRRWVWMLLHKLLTDVGVPLMRKLKL